MYFIAHFRITSIQDLQLNLKIEGAKGRVFITEIEKEPVHGVRPLERYEKGQRITVKVLGTKMVSTSKK